MFAPRGVKLLSVIIAVVTLPSAAALGWYYYTQDPTLRPLGISKDDMVREEDGKRVEIVAHIRWDDLREAFPVDQFQHALVEAFDIKNIEIRIEVIPTPGKGTFITYDVGASHIGPFSKPQAAKGVNAAIDAFRMYQTQSSTP